jgi:hypothetical protein
MLWRDIRPGCPEKIEIEVAVASIPYWEIGLFQNGGRRVGGSGGAIHPISPQRIPQEIAYLFDVA